MRAPSSGAPTSELYAADNHLPSPVVLASAIAARTKRLAIMLATVVLPFWDPVRLAEDLSVLYIISNGRVSYAFGIGHRVEEYQHFGVDVHGRGRLADKKLTLLRALLTGEPVECDGRPIHITPRSTSPGGPLMMVAGGSRAA